MDLLELFGREYVIEYCLNSYKERENERIFRVYVADSLNIALGLGVRYSDVMVDSQTKQMEEEEETRTAEEIKNSIKDGLNRLGSNTKVEV